MSLLSTIVLTWLVFYSLLTIKKNDLGRGRERNTTVSLNGAATRRTAGAAAPIPKPSAVAIAMALHPVLPVAFVFVGSSPTTRSRRRSASADYRSVHQPSSVCGRQELGTTTLRCLSLLPALGCAWSMSPAGYVCATEKSSRPTRPIRGHDLSHATPSNRGQARAIYACNPSGHQHPRARPGPRTPSTSPDTGRSNRPPPLATADPYRPSTGVSTTTRCDRPSTLLAAFQKTRDPGT